MGSSLIAQILIGKNRVRLEEGSKYERKTGYPVVLSRKRRVRVMNLALSFSTCAL